MITPAYSIRRVPAVDAGLIDPNWGAHSLARRLGPINIVEWVLGPTFSDTVDQVLDGMTIEDIVNATARNDGALANFARIQLQKARETGQGSQAETASVPVAMNVQHGGAGTRGETPYRWHAAPIAERDDIYTALALAFLTDAKGKPNLLCALE